MRLRLFVAFLFTLLCLIEFCEAEARPEPRPLWFRRAVRSIGRGVTRAVRTVGRSVRRGVRTVGRGVVRVVRKVVDVFEGCCGIRSQVCKDEREVERRRRDIKAKTANMDKDWVHVKKVLARLNNGNLYNGQIVQQVKRITMVSYDSIEILDPAVMTRFNDITNELKKQIQHKNQTVINYGINELSNDLQKADDGTKTALLDASGVGGFAMTEGYLKMTSDMFRMVKLDMVANFLDSDVGGLLQKAKLGISKLFGLDRLEELSKQNKVLAVIFTGINFYNKYLSWGSNIFKLMDGITKIIGWITDLAGCKKRADEIHKSVVKLREDHAKVNEAVESLRTTKKSVDEGWQDVVTQARKPALIGALKEVEDIARHSSGKSQTVETARREITEYINKVHRASPDDVISLQKRLVSALNDVTYTSECYNRKMGVFQAVYRRCKTGDDSLSNLWKDALMDFQPNDDTCKSISGLPYTSFEEVKKFVKDKATKEKFEENCLLNSESKQVLVCELVHQKYTIEEIASQTNSTLKTLEKIIVGCPRTVLTPSDKKEICSLKPNMKVSSLFAMFSDVIQKYKFNQIYAQCG